MLQWEPENYGTKRQNHSVFDVDTKHKTLIINLLNHLFRYIPSNNFLSLESAEIPRNLSLESAEIPWNLLQENPVKMLTAFQRNFSNPFWDTRYKEFLVTHFDEIFITLSKEFLVTYSRELFVTNSADKLEKMSTNFMKILGNFQKKVLQNQFLEIF